MALYSVWPFSDGFVAFLAMMIVREAVSVAGWNGRGAYTLEIFSREERVESQAFMRAAINLGFTLGALIGGTALGAAHIGHTAGSGWAPALFTWLALEHGTTGWLVIAAMVVVATVTTHTTSRSAERDLERTTAPR